METLNGQSFAQAYSNVWQQMFFSSISPANVTAQQFFESALGGATSSYCVGYASCTAALVSKNTALFKETAVSDIWNAMTKTSGWTLGRTVFSQPVTGGTLGQATSLLTSTSLGFGNYNALFVSLRSLSWHGLTAISNFTFGRSLGTATQIQATSSATPLTPFAVGDNYNSQNGDVKFLYNLSMFYTLPFFKGQHGILGHILGGWTLSPLFTAQSGSSNGVSYTEGSCGSCEAFGEVTTPGTSGTSSTSEGAVGLLPYTGNMQTRYNIYPTGATNGYNLVEGTASVGTKTSGYYGLNAFSKPAEVWAEFRPCVLGYDTRCGGGLRGLPTWNLDANLVKDIAIYKERVGAQFFWQVTNALNHFQSGGPSLSLTSPTTFGQEGGGGTPRNMEFGLRIHF